MMTCKHMRKCWLETGHHDGALAQLPLINPTQGVRVWGSHGFNNTQGTTSRWQPHVICQPHAAVHCGVMHLCLPANPYKGLRTSRKKWVILVQRFKLRSRLHGRRP